mmetsp:Transcript_4882/g.8106  ORF Transcript_4882/g.8106 Transcript_4882/m.8106 type:complete len:116 (+) Transcript_4882:2-349(+)
MYFNTIATNQLWTLYFIIYITVVSIVIANVFVGLFLADIDQLSQQQSHDDIIHASVKQKSFQSYAAHKLNQLHYKIGGNEHENELMRRQVRHIEFILQQHQQMKHQDGLTSSYSE